MTDPADRFLEERLHALARGVSLPVVTAEDDVRRGRRRLLRMRVAMAGATTATLAVVLGVTSLTAGDPKASEPPLVTQPPTATPPATPSSSPSADRGADVQPGGQGKSGAGGNGNQVVDDPAADHSTQHTDGTGVSVNKAPTGAATGDSTHGNTSSGFHHQPGGTNTSEPSELPSSTVTPTQAPTPSDTPTSTPTEAPTETPTPTPTPTPTVPPTEGTKVRVHKVLRYYNDVLAEHLDPDRAHLHPYNRKSDTKETTTANGMLYALGSTYRWEDGRSRSGLEITVASGWDQVDWLCGASYADWDCEATDPTGAGTGEVATHDGVRQVAVEHADGQVVVIAADVGSETDLVAAAADERLTLPGDAPVAPPSIDADAFAAAGVAALVKAGETFEQDGIDRSPWVRGVWSVGGVERGTLSWTVEPAYSRGPFECLTTFRSCSQVTVAGLGTTVHLAFLKKRAGGGWLVQYDGGSYGVRVYSSDRKLPKKRTYAFVTQTAWQPTR